MEIKYISIDPRETEEKIKNLEIDIGASEENLKTTRSPIYKTIIIQEIHLLKKHLNDLKEIIGQK